MISRITGEHLPMTRRHLLRVTGVSLGALAVGPLLGCQAGQPSSSPTGGRPSNARDAFAAAVQIRFTDLEPSVIPTPGALISSYYWGERLYRTDPLADRGTLYPQLALDAPEEVAPGVFRITIRDDAIFHSGDPLTAEDVAFTFDWVKNPDTGSFWGQYVNVIDSVRATGPQELEVHSGVSPSLLPARLALLPIRPKTATEPFTLAPVGSGPYRVTSAASDQRIAMERYADYAGDGDFAYPMLQFDLFTDSAARLAGLRTGQYQMTDEVPPLALAELASDSTLETAAVDSYAWTLASFNCGKPPFDDVRLRQAVAYAIDRDAISEATYQGHATPAWSGFVSPHHHQFTEPDTVYRYDPAQAEALVSASALGRSGPIPIDVLIVGELPHAPIIEENLARAGFAPNLIPLTPQAGTQRASEGNYNLSFNSDPADNSLLSDDLEFLMRLSFTGFIADTLLHWTGAERDSLTSLLDRSIVEPDAEARGEQLAEAENIIQEQVPILALHHTKRINAWSADLEGFRPSPLPGVVLDGVSG